MTTASSPSPRHPNQPGILISRRRPFVLKTTPGSPRSLILIPSFLNNFPLSLIVVTMMIPNEFDSFPKATATLPLITPTSVAPIPTVIPGTPLYQDLHDTGKRTLW